MDTRRCLEILELESVTSPEALKQAYRDMVQIWHPDRFHGNSRLEKLASAKLKDINRAYSQLLACFDPGQRQRLRTSGSPGHDPSSQNTERYTSGIHSRKQAGNTFNAKDDLRNEPTEPFNHFKIYAAPRRSLFGKIIALFGLCIFVVIAGLIIYFIINKDELTSKSMGVAVKALERITDEFEIKLAPKVEGNGAMPKAAPSLLPNRLNLSEGNKAAGLGTYFEIHIDGGTIILTESWWHKDDMIMYKQHGGTMGIEEDRVKKIVEKQMMQ